MLAKLFRILTLTALLVLPWGATVALAQSQPQSQPQARSDAFPLTVTDDSGVSTTLAAPPQRVVSLNPGLTEITFALGHGDSLVGVDSYSDFPPEARDIQPRLQAFPNPSIEAIVALQPDLVLTLAESDDVIAQLRAQGIPVLKMFPNDYDATVEAVRTLGRVYGSPDAGEAIATDLTTRRDAVVAAVAGAAAPRLRRARRVAARHARRGWSQWFLWPADRAGRRDQHLRRLAQRLRSRGRREHPAA